MADPIAADPRAAAPGAADRPPLFALLVGISEYDSESGVPALRGGVNDARSLAHLLRHDFGVPADDIVTLVDGAATLAAIESAVQHHLLARGKRWSAHHPHAAKRGERPSFLFHFSGYGIQARTDSGALENALVPWDSLSPPGEVLRASEMSAWVERLEAIGSVTLILDCSTTPVRSAESPPVTRALPPDMRLPASQGVKRAASSMAGWDFGAATVLVACRPGEAAHERVVVSSKVGDATTETWHGALTSALRERLLALPPGAAIGNRALGASLLERVNALCGDQHPSLRGSQERLFLGGLRRSGDGRFAVLGEGDGLWWIEGGSAHALAEGAELVVSRPDTVRPDTVRANTVRPNTVQQCTLRVVRVEGERSGCRVVEVGATVAAGERASLTRAALPVLRQGVRLLLESPRERYRLAAMIDGPLADDEARAWLECVAAGEALRVVQSDAGIVIADGSGAYLAGGWSPAQLEEVAAALVNVARRRWLWSLRNESPHTHAAALECVLRQVNGSRGGARLAGPALGGEGVVVEGTPLVLDVVNRSAEPLYVGIFEVANDGGSRLLHPTGFGSAPLAPGALLALPVRNERDDALTHGVGVVERRIKVIALGSDVDWEAIERGDAAAFGALAQATRDSNPVEVSASACWATEEVRFQVVATPATHDLHDSAESDPERRATLGEPPASAGIKTLGRGVSIETPPHFRGRARLLTARQSMLLRGVETIALPPGLAPFPELFAPATVGSPGKRATLAMIELECDDEARRSISSETPLILRTPQQEGVALFALALVNGGWYPVGRARIDAAAPSAAVAIEWLPSSTIAHTNPQVGGSAPAAGDDALSITRVIRIFLFRILDEPVASLGLYNVRFVPAGWAASASRASFVRKVAGGELRYTAATPLRTGERVALLVHGVGSDTAELALWLSTTLRRMGVVYDRVLAWEYEGIGTPVHENAVKLGKTIKALGAGTEEGVALDLYTHSMGGIIARDLVEGLGGDKIVRNVIFAAPPNLGTPLADAALLAPWLIALGVNLPLPTPSGILIAWALGTLASEAQGIADLSRRSPLLEKLNSSERRVAVRYHVIAGDAALEDDETSDADAGDEDARRPNLNTLLAVLAEGLKRGAGWYFEGENDLVVPVRSVTGLRVNQAAGSHVLTCILRCNHFGYYESETVALQVARWLLGSGEGNPQTGSGESLWYDFIAPHTIERAANGNGQRTRQVIAFRHRMRGRTS